MDHPTPARQGQRPRSSQSALAEARRSIIMSPAQPIGTEAARSFISLPKSRTVHSKSQRRVDSVTTRLTSHAYRRIFIGMTYDPGSTADETEDLLPLHRNEPHGEIKELMRTFQRREFDFTSYGDSTNASLRRDIAVLHHTEPANVLVGAGADGVLAALFEFAAANKHESVLVRQAPYLVYAELAQRTRLPISTVAPAELHHHAAKSRSIVFWDSPSAIRGTHDLPLALQSASANPHALHVLDLAYSAFAHCPPPAIANLPENVVTVHSFSKRFGAPGLRLGYALGPPPIIAEAKELGDVFPVNAAAASLAKTLLENYDGFEVAAANIVERRDMLASAIRSMGFSVAQSQGNSLFVETSSMEQALSFQRHLKGAGYLVRHFPVPEAEAGIRVGVPESNETDRLLQAICSFTRAKGQ